MKRSEKINKQIDTAVKTVTTAPPVANVVRAVANAPAVQKVTKSTFGQRLKSFFSK